MPWPRPSVFAKGRDLKVTPIGSAGRTINAFLGAISLASLLGCQIGPIAIQHGRFDYNEVIQRTNQEQTFVNIIRVYDHKSTAFMDVTEIDAVVLGSASLSGGIGGIGAGIANTTGETGSVTGTLQYQESPTIRYQPLLGQALTTQLSTPLTVDSLSSIISSGWDPRAVLDFALDRIVPDPEPGPQRTTRYKALDLIFELWDDDALIISSGKVQTAKLTDNIPKPPDNQVKTEAGIGNISIQVNNNTNNSGSDGGRAGAGPEVDSLILYFNPRRRIHAAENLSKWNQLLRIYQGTQDKETPPYQIFLRAGPGLRQPVIQIRSALGILKAATQRNYSIWFIAPKEYEQYREEERKKQGGEFDPCKVPFYSHPRDDARHYLLIIHSKTLPAAPSRPYVSHFDPQSGEYYYIAGDDCKSKDSFALLSLFLSIQAVQGPPPLTPTISVGSKPGG